MTPCFILMLYCPVIPIPTIFCRIKHPVFIISGDRGSTVVKVLCYKSEGRWFDSSWRHWNFSLT